MLIGPGLGRCDEVSEVVESVLEYSKVPVIIDADGINAVAENMKALSSCTCPVIFTPHTVEMSRLTGLEREYIEDNRLVTAKGVCGGKRSHFDFKRTSYDCNRSGRRTIY